MEQYTILTLFLMCFLSSTLIPFSSEVIFYYFLHSSNSSPILIILIASLGNSLGSILTYWMGYFTNSIFIKNKKIKIIKYRESIQKYGSLMSILSILPFIGDIVVLSMGFFKTNRFWTHLFLIITKTSRYYLIYKLQIIF